MRLSKNSVATYKNVKINLSVISVGQAMQWRLNDDSIMSVISQYWPI